MFNWELFFLVFGGGISLGILFLIALLAGYLYSEERFILGTGVGFGGLLLTAIMIGFVG